jgi:hypothetical protein
MLSLSGGLLCFYGYDLYRSPSAWGRTDAPIALESLTATTLASFAVVLYPRTANCKMRSS